MLLRLGSRHASRDTLMQEPSVVLSIMINIVIYLNMYSQLMTEEAAETLHHDLSKGFCSVGLKEWDAQVQALGQGLLSLVVRKGGIWEIRKDFEVKHQRFWFYPTFLHQNSQDLRFPVASGLRSDPNPGWLRLDTFAEVKAVWKVTHIEQVLALENWQALNQDALRRRFLYKDKPWLYAILLDVWRQTVPICLAETKAYAGCVSWVPLEVALDTRSLQPVLDASVQQQRLESLVALLGDPMALAYGP